MSLDAAIGSIDQILSLRQQIFDPSAVTGGASVSGTTAAAGAASTTSSTSASSFASLLASAEQQSEMSSISDGDSDSGDTSDTTVDPLTSGLSDVLSMAGLQTAGSTATTGTTGLTGTTATTGLTGTTTTTGTAPAQVQSMVDEANSLVGKPYVWGGGHSGWGEQSGYDCSGFVSAVLHAGGYLSEPQDTQTLPQQAGIESGAGQYVTIYDRTDAGTGNDHVIIDLDGQFYESGGEQGAWGGGGGVEKIDTPSASYLATFNRVLHPEGL